MRDVPWKYIFKLSPSDSAREFCEWVQIEIDIYIPHRKYQVKRHSPPWFLTACAAALAHRNHFFCLYQQNKSSESKLKLYRLKCKRVLEAAKHAYNNRTKTFVTSQKLAFGEFWRIASSVLNNGYSAIPPLFN